MRLRYCIAVGVMASTIASGVIAAEAGSREAPLVLTEQDYTVVSRPRAVYPERALRMDKSGAATITCRVMDDGQLTGCFVTSETPKNYDFGEAAIELTRHFRVKTPTANGVALPGKWITLTQKFTLE